MTGEEFKGFGERFYDFYGEDFLEKGDKFEIRLKTGEVMDVDKDNVYFPLNTERLLSLKSLIKISVRNIITNLSRLLKFPI